MERVYYEVGQHMYSVQGTKAVDVRALLSSSEPFRLLQAPISPVPLLFEMWVDTHCPATHLYTREEYENYMAGRR